jgi:glutamine amidotransferase
LAVPQVGWNQLQPRRAHSLLANLADGSFFYFVHSYYCHVSDPAVVLAQAEYGVKYPSVIAQCNLLGVQFHPEKSQAVGLRLLKNFAAQ